MNMSAPSSPSLSSSSTTTTSWFSGIVRGRFDKSNSAKMANNSAAPVDDNLGPINKKKQFRGVMFKYGPKPIQVCQNINSYSISSYLEFRICYLVIDLIEI